MRWLALRAAVSVVPVSAMIAGGAVAHAGPVHLVDAQPGVTAPDPPSTQPGVTAPDQPTVPHGNSGPIQPGVTTPPPPPPMAYVSPQDDSNGVAPATDDGPSRSVPDRSYISPMDLGKMHTPEPSRPVAPITPAPGVLRVGDISTAAPNFLTRDQIAQINAGPAAEEAQISRFARSVGAAPSRADSIAAAAVAGGLQGAVGGSLAGAAILGIPTLGLGAVPGCLAGGAIGLAAVR